MFLLWEYIKAVMFYTSWFGMTAIVLVICIPALFYVKWLPGIIKIWAKMSLVLLRIFHGLEVDCIIDEPLRQSGQVIACNHQSALEILVLANRVPNPVFLYKSSLKWVPLLNLYLWRSGHISVARNRSKTGVIDKVMKKLETNNVIIFPEGTRVEYKEKDVVTSIYKNNKVSNVIESNKVSNVIESIAGKKDLHLRTEDILENRLMSVEKEVKEYKFGTVYKKGVAIICKRIEDQRLPYEIIPAYTNTGKFWARKSVLKRKGRAFLHIGKKFNTKSSENGTGSVEEIMNEIKQSMESL